MRVFLHADVYRLDQLHEVVDLGLGELVDDGGVALVEWGDAPRRSSGGDALAVRLAPADDDSRQVTVEPGRREPGPIAWRPVGRAALEPWRGRPVILLAIESATDLVGVGLVRYRRRRGRAGPPGGSGPRRAAGAGHRGGVRRVRVHDRRGRPIAVDIGPGLFTGLRVGVATAKALGQALGLGVLGVGSLDVLAAARPPDRRIGGGAAAPVASVVDARRGEVFAAAYRFDRAGTGGRLRPIDPATVRYRPAGPDRSGDLVAWLLNLAEEPGRSPWWGTVPCATARVGCHPRLDLGRAAELSAPRRWPWPVWPAERLDVGVPPVAAVELVPDYRRPADARINWEQRAPRRHRPVDPGGARARAVNPPDPSRPARRCPVIVAPMRTKDLPRCPADRGGGVPPALVAPAVRRGAGPADVGPYPGRLGRALHRRFRRADVHRRRVPREQHRRRSRRGRAAASAPS